jgi:hypothetical protein
MKRSTILMGTIILIVCSLLLGLFILPREIKSTRWMEVNAPSEVVWEKLYPIASWSEWNTWSGEGDDSSQPFWNSQNVTLTDVDIENKRIVYEVVGQKASGSIKLDQQPDQLWVQWEHEFEADYSPWSRLIDWSSRSGLALELDAALKSLGEASEAEIID